LSYTRINATLTDAIVEITMILDWLNPKIINSDLVLTLERADERKTGTHFSHPALVQNETCGKRRHSRKMRENSSSIKMTNSTKIMLD
jgi:hypothetical protein